MIMTFLSEKRTAQSAKRIALTSLTPCAMRHALCASRLYDFFQLRHEALVLLGEAYRYPEPFSPHGPDDHPLFEERGIDVFCVDGGFEEDKVGLCRDIPDAEPLKGLIEVLFTLVVDCD